MNKTLYWVIGIVIVIVLGYGAYRIIKHNKNLSMYNNSAQPTTTAGNTNPSTVPVVSNTGSTGFMNKTDTSNQQLDQDLQDVQVSIDKLNSDQNQAGQAVSSNQSSDTPSQ